MQKSFRLLLLLASCYYLSCNAFENDRHTSLSQLLIGQDHLVHAHAHAPKSTGQQTDAFFKNPEDERRVDKELSGVFDDNDPGMMAAARNLYRGDSHHPWDTSVPAVPHNIEDSSESKKYAVVVRRERSGDSNQGLTLHSITVQSPLLRNALHEVFEGMPGITTKLKDLTFNAPFHEFFFCWERLTQLLKEETDEQTLQHLELLRTILDPEMQPHLEHRKDLLDNGLITYEHLWTLFEPAVEVYQNEDGHDRLHQLVRAQYRGGYQKSFQLLCKYVDYDGSSFGWVTSSFNINEFEGVIPIKDLEVIPSSLHPHAKQLRVTLAKRGRSLQALRGFHFKAYSGPYRPVDERYGPRQRKHVSMPT